MPMRYHGPMINAKEFYAPDRGAWRAWLAANHATEQSVWLVYDKDAGRALTYEAIVEEALCFGWIDSVSGKVSETQRKLYISRRKPQSAWAKSNKERVERLRALGLMTPAGERAIAAAQANGAWSRLDASDRLELPPELVRQLEADPTAKAFFESMSPSSQRIILEWIYAARTEVTQLKRITETVALATRGIKAHHQRQ
jgi:uncharacterized protein YdeI (YjbR/CyaY-like superfamily)